MMDALLQQEGREGFAAAWFRHHGYGDAAQRMEDWWRRQRRDDAAPGDSDAKDTLALRGAE